MASNRAKLVRVVAGRFIKCAVRCSVRLPEFPGQNPHPNRAPTSVGCGMECDMHVKSSISAISDVCPDAHRRPHPPPQTICVHDREIETRLPWEILTLTRACSKGLTAPHSASNESVDGATPSLGSHLQRLVVYCVSPVYFNLPLFCWGEYKLHVLSISAVRI